MSRKKEIDVWVDKDFEEILAEKYAADFRDHEWGDCRIKAKLIIELPERRVEISESQFDRLIGLDKTVDTGWVRNKLFKEQA